MKYFYLECTVTGHYGALSGSAVVSVPESCPSDKDSLIRYFNHLDSNSLVKWAGQVDDKITYEYYTQELSSEELQARHDAIAENIKANILLLQEELNNLNVLTLEITDSLVRQLGLN